MHKRSCSGGVGRVSEALLYMRPTAAQLQAFEQEIAELFRQKQIRGPIHLAGGNEEQLIQIFQNVGHDDWVLATHRSHYAALLHGVPPEKVRAEILAGHSMHLNWPEHRFLTSAIVGGIAPIAVGLALGIKRRGEDRRVWCFIGDMSAETGLVHESIKYSGNFRLPVSFVIEDNHLSTDTPTHEAWGHPPTPESSPPTWEAQWNNGGVIRYSAPRTWPHTGVGHWVNF